MNSASKIYDSIGTDIPQICMLSSQFLGIAGVIFKELTPMGNYIKVGEEIIDKLRDQNPDIESELMLSLINVVNKAWDLTRKQLGGNSRALIDEVNTLLADNIELFSDKFENFNDFQFEKYQSRMAELIMNTEAYANSYLTPKTIKDIVSKFDTNFNLCVSQNSLLAPIYAKIDIDRISDMLKSMSVVIKEEGYKIDNMLDILSNVNLNVNKIKNVINYCLLSLITIIIATGIQAIFYYIFKKHYDSTFILLSAISFAVSELLTYFLAEQLDIYVRLSRLSIKSIPNPIYIQYILPIVISLFSFWIIYNVTDIYNLRFWQLLGYIFGMVIGYTISITLKLYLIKQEKEYF